jgi:ubiquinol-cytochrome c reductase cytochrome b subunit
VERRVTGDRGAHNLLDWPWENPFRAASGAAILSVFAVLTLAGGNDVIAAFLDLPVETLTWIFRVLAIAVPVATFLVTWALCVSRRSRPAPDDAHPAGSGGELGARHRGGTAVRRNAAGGFDEGEG